MKGTTKGEDIFGEVKKAFNTYNSDWSKLCGVSTDGAPAMIGVRSGLVHRIKEEIRDRKLNPDSVTASYTRKAFVLNLLNSVMYYNQL